MLENAVTRTAALADEGKVGVVEFGRAVDHRILELILLPKNLAGKFSENNDDDLPQENSWSACYAAKFNSFVIRSDGRIGKCTVALRDKRNVIGVLKDDGAMEIRPDLIALWARGWQRFDRTALYCPLDGLPEARI